MGTGEEGRGREQMPIRNVLTLSPFFFKEPNSQLKY